MKNRAPVVYGNDEDCNSGWLDKDLYNNATVTVWKRARIPSDGEKEIFVPLF